MNTLRFGILGTGAVARYHAPSILDLPECTLVAVASKTKAHAEAYAEKWGCLALDSLEDLLSREDIDVIALCTPSGNHYRGAKKVLLSGKHVIIEKPMCFTVEEGKELIGIAEEKNLMISVILQNRYSKAIEAIKKAKDNGDFGRMVSAQCQMRFLRTKEYFDSADWRGTRKAEGGGILINQGIHGIDLMCYIMGMPKSVMAYTKTLLRDIETEDTAVASVEFTDGSLGVIDATLCSSPALPKRFIFTGEKGTVVMEDDRILLWSLPTPQPEDENFFEDGSPFDPRVLNMVYHKRQFQNIRDHLLYQKPLLIDGKEGLMALSLVLGAYESSKSGRRVEI